MFKQTNKCIVKDLRLSVSNPIGYVQTFASKIAHAMSKIGFKSHRVCSNAERYWDNKSSIVGFKSHRVCSNQKRSLKSCQSCCGFKSHRVCSNSPPVKKWCLNLGFKSHRVCSNDSLAAAKRKKVSPFQIP